MAGRNKKNSKELRLTRKELSDEVEDGGKCRKCLCDILTLRVLVYILKQPPSCTFIVTLFVIAACLPFIGLYISNQSVLPDLDAMQNWNAYIGRLGQNNYCFKIEPDSRKKDAFSNASSLFTSYPPFNNSVSITNNWTMVSTCLRMEFDVDRSAVLDDENDSEDVVLIASLTGQEIRTQIKCDGRRIDRDGVFLHFWLNVSKSDKSCTELKCRVNASVLITAPSRAVPTRLPQVHEDFSFQTRVANCKKSHRCPATLCDPIGFLGLSTGKNTSVAVVTKTDDCSGAELAVVSEHKFGAKANGIIKIFLSEEDRQTAAHHMYWVAVALAALSLTFTIGILLTDRPSEPKPSVE